MTASKTPNLDRVQRYDELEHGIGHETSWSIGRHDCGDYVRLDDVRAAVALDMAAREADARRDALQEAARFSLAEGERIRNHWQEFADKHPGDDFARERALDAHAQADTLGRFADKLDAMALTEQRDAVQATTAAESNELQEQHAHANMPPLPR